jgi:hypothetical protein
MKNTQLKNLFMFIILVMMFFDLKAQQQESYTFCTGSSYAYLLDTTTSSTSSYYARFNIGSTSYVAKFQNDTIYQTANSKDSEGTKEGGEYSKVKKWACTSTTTATLLWTYTPTGAHHDICPLPNGNVLIIVNETKTSSQISAVGGSYSGSASFPVIQEIHPTGSTTGTVVWQWKLFDHLCQTTNSSVTSTYVSSIASNPQLFNLALVTSSDFFHMNGLDYNPTLDQIVCSSHMLNEIYVIDHSTITAEAATHTGGNAGKGGDFLYRWGSPDNYGLSSTGNGITLNVIHDVRWVPSTNQDYPNYISIFHNGGCSSGKGIVLFLPPHNGYNYTYTPGSVIGPTSCTTPTTPSFSVSNQGGAMVCENGNILITNPGSKFYECNGTGTTYQQISVSTIQSDRLKKCDVLGPFPSASTSSASVCVGTAFTLNSSAAAPLQTSPSYTYSWSSTPSGFTSSLQNPSVTPAAAGSYTYVVTVTSGGCSNTASVAVTANALPSANAGNDVTINSGSSTTLTATGGGTYLWSNGATTASTTVTPTNTTTYTVTVTSNGCTASDNVVVTVTAGTLSVTTSATPAAVCSGTSVQLDAAPSGGTSYTYNWVSNPTGFTSTVQSPTVSPTQTTTYTVTVTSGGSSATSSVTVTVYALPSASAGNDVTICSGSSTALTASSGTSYTYSWTSNPAGFTSTLQSPTVSPTSTTTYTVTITNANSCTASDAVVVTVNATAAASVSITASPSGSICSGTSVTFTATAVNGGTAPSYQWKNNGTNISGATNSTYTSSSLANGDVITCTMTSDLTCVTGSPATSNSITMTVNSTVAASVSITSNPTGSICSGTSVSFTASAVNGGTTPVYQWKNNGTNISGATNSTYTSTTLSNGDVITCALTSTLTCVTGSPATSNSITMAVTSSGAASISITASPSGGVCTGTSVTFTATPTNGGSAPTYQWKNNGLNISGATTSTYTSSALANGDIITCTMTSNLTCVTGSPATSNSITMSISSTQASAVSIAANPGGAICIGTSVTFTATATNGGSSPSYQWLKNGTNISGATNSTYISASLADGDVVTCLMTSSLSCSTGSPATSNAVTIIITSTLPASVSISASPSGTICSETSVTFTASPTNGGSAPAYQWKNNGTNISGATNSTYTSTSLANGDVITCSMTSDLTCVTGSPATSNAITMSVTSSLPASVSISANPSSSICTGTNVIFTAIPTNGGTSPTYQWNINGTNISGATNTTYASSALSDGDIISCEMTSNATCVSGSPATSNTIIISVSPSLTASVSISVSPSNIICDGATATFTASAVNGGTSPTFQWQVNGTNVGTNLSIYSSSSFNDGDIISCIMLSSENCVSGSPAYSNTITITEVQSVTASVLISAVPGTSVCEGTAVTFTATATNGGTNPVYQWKVNGTNAGTNSSAYTSASLIDYDIVTCTLTSSETCVTNNPANSNALTMTIIPAPLATIDIAAYPADSVCEGTPFTFTATSLNGGSNPSYQWQINGSDVGINSSTYTSLLNDGDVVSCTMTSSLSCVSGNPAASNIINANVNPIPPTPIITKNGDTLYSSASSGNQWYFQNTVGNMPISGAINQYYVPSYTGEYFAIITNEWGCISDTSNIIPMDFAGLSENTNTEFSIFPNPTDGIIRIEYTQKNGSFFVTIYNTLGELLLEKENPSEINLSEFENGTYYLKFQSNNSFVISKKLILIK